MPTNENANSAVSQLSGELSRLKSRLNSALLEVNGSVHLPVWMEKSFNGSLSSISADSLQGMRVVTDYILGKLAEIDANKG